MAINSSLSHFSHLDENFVANNSHVKIHYISHTHEDMMCISSSGSDFCNMVHLNPRKQIIYKDSLYRTSAASHFNNKEEDFGYKYFFNEFINTRIEYLESLKALGNNWISGESKEPPVKSIDLSKKLLKNIRNWFSSDNCVMSVPPKIIMSPIPVGGVSIEIYFYDKVNYLLRILENTIELEKEEEGFYSEIKVTEESVFDEVISSFKKYDFV